MVMVTEGVHDLQNLDADNCEQMAATKTLEALDANRAAIDATQAALDANHQEVVQMGKELEAGQKETHQKVVQMRKELEAGQKETHQKVVQMRKALEAGQKETHSLIDHAIAGLRDGQRQMQQMESRMAGSFAQAAQQASLMHAKLDRLLTKAEETLDYIRLGNYQKLAADFVTAVALLYSSKSLGFGCCRFGDRFTSSKHPIEAGYQQTTKVSAMSGAYEDMTAAFDQIQKQKKALKISDDRTSVKNWFETARNLRLLILMKLQDIWARSQDSFDRAMAIIVEGDFLMLHYTMLLRDAAERLLHKSSYKNVHEVFSGEVIELLAKEFNQDETIVTLQTVLVRMTSMADIMEKVTPNAQISEKLGGRITAYTSHLLDIRKRLESTEFLDDVLQPSLLVNFGLGIDGVHEKNLVFTAETMQAVIGSLYPLMLAMDPRTNVPVPAALALTCTFENGKCNYKEVGQRTWTRCNTSTSSSGTGPSGPKQGSYYIYTEASGNFKKQFILESPIFAVTKPSKLRFHYHMLGRRMGSLTVSFMESGTTHWRQLSHVRGNQGAHWLEATLTLPSEATRLRFTGRTGFSSSDIALDDITVTEDR